jgi:hypothetical protein
VLQAVIVGRTPLTVWRKVHGSVPVIFFKPYLFNRSWIVLLDHTITVVTAVTPDWH